MDRNTLLQDSDLTARPLERRRSLRQKLHSPVYVSFNGPEAGMVVDLSELLDLHEQGFAVQTALPAGLQSGERLEVNRAVTLCLELPETRKYLHGSGQVMWTDNTGRAGIRFSFLPEGSRQILQEWLFANLLVASTNHAARARQLAQVVPALPATDGPPPGSIVHGLRAQEVSAARKSLEPMPAISNDADAALSGRAELLSSLDAVRREVREIESRHVEGRELDASADLDAILQLIAARAVILTGASGAALALRDGKKMLCRARAGDPAPPVGSEVDVNAGLSGECVRNGILVTCKDPATDPRVDPDVCRMLGIGSFVAAPLLTDSRVVGLLEIFSPRPRTFTRLHGTILQRLAELVPGIKEGKIEVIRNAETKNTTTNNAGTTTAEKKPPQTKPAEGTILETAIAEAKPGEAGIPRTKNDEAVLSLKSIPIVRKAEPQKANGNSSRPEPSEASFATPVEKLKETQAPPGAIRLQEESQTSDHLQPSVSVGRRHYSIQLLLLLLVLGTVAMVLGYVLAPAIQKRWSGAPQSGQNSSPTLAQNSGLASKAFSPSSFSRPSSTDARVRSLSVEELRRMGEQGDADAQYQLGILYHEGSTVPKDDAQAVQWFKRAAEQGFVRAQSTLGAYYWAGRGVPQDYSKAYFWSQLALAQGDENSKSRLEGLSAQMTRSQVAEARQQAEVWLHSHTLAKPSPGSK